MALEAEFWVAVAFVIFLGILGRAGVHRKVLVALDRRRDAIKRELNDARDIRTEAEAVLREAHRKQREAADEIDQVVDDARDQARRLIAEVKSGTEEFMRRGARVAEAKIAQAERQAVADVRAMVSEIAISAAEKVLIHSVNGEVAERSFRHGIEAVKANLGKNS